MRTRVLYFIAVLALVAGLVTAMATVPAMAARIEGEKDAIPAQPNIYYVGDTIEYEMTVSNPVDDHSNHLSRIWDTLPDGTVIEFLAPDEKLVQAPGDSETFHEEYTVDEGDLIWLSDLEYWVVRNVFEAEGENDVGEEVEVRVVLDSRVIRPNTRVSIDIDTDVHPDRRVVAGQEFDLIITEENTGYDELTDVFVRVYKAGELIETLDDKHPSWSCDGDGDDVLDPGETWSWTIEGVTITETTDFVALGFGTDPLGNEISYDMGYEDERDVETVWAEDPKIQIKKYTNGYDAYDPEDPDVPEIAVGDNVTWTYDITNLGDVPLTDIVVTDDPEGVIGTIASLPAGQSETLTHTGTAVAGLYANTGYVEGYYEGVKVEGNDRSHYFGLGPSIDLQKEVWDGSTWHDADTATGPELTSEQDPVVFRFVITNDGNVELTDVGLTDTDMVDFYENFDRSVPATFPITLDEDESVTVYGSLDWEPGQHENTATVEGFYDTTRVEDEDLAHYFGLGPDIQIRKLTNGVDAPSPPGPSITIGDTVTWTYIVTNTGGVPLTNIEVTDNKEGPIGNIALLAVGESQTLTATGTAQEGQYANIGSVVGYHNNVEVSDNDPSHYRGVKPVVVGWVTYPVNRMSVLAPWIALLAAFIAGTTLLVLRRRKALN